MIYVVRSLSGFGDAAGFAEVVGVGEEDLIGAVGSDEEVGGCNVGLVGADEVEDFVVGVAAEMDGAFDEETETEHHFDFEAGPVVVAVETEGRIASEGGNLDGMAFEFGQFGHRGDRNGVDLIAAPTGKHLVERSVGFDFDEEVVELTAEFLVFGVEGCCHVEASRKVEVDSQAVLAHFEGFEDYGVGDGTVGRVRLDGLDELSGGLAADKVDVGEIGAVAQENVAGAACDNGHSVTFETLKIGVSSHGGGLLGSVVAGG